jgi:hypothetical protein
MERKKKRKVKCQSDGPRFENLARELSFSWISSVGNSTKKVRSKDRISILDQKSVG